MDYWVGRSGLLKVHCFVFFLWILNCREEEARGEQWTELLSWEPRAFLYHNFLVWNSVLVGYDVVVFWFTFA